MDHDALTYTLQNNNGQVMTLRNWQQQSWGTHEVAGTTTVGTPQVDLLTCSLGFYAWYDRNAHSIFAQFQSPAVVTSTPPVSISLGIIPGIDLVTSLSIQRVNRRLYILYGSENGHAGLLEVEYSGDGTSVNSTLQKIESQPIVNNANVESIGFGNDGGEAGHWRIVENTFLHNLEALYTLNETSSGSGTTDLSPTSNSASTTSLVQNGGQVSQNNGVFPRVTSDTVHFATATDRLRIPRTVVEKNAGVLHDEFSVALWFRHYSNINYGVVFQSSVDDSSAYVIQLESGGGGSMDLRLYLNNSAVTTLETDVQSDDTFSFTEWTLLTVTVDKDGDITIYVNDKQAYNAGVDNTVWGDMVIGAGGNASGSNTADDTFVGYVDYIGVWTQRRLRLLDVHLWFNGQRGLPPVYLHKYTSDDQSSFSLSKQQKKYLKYVYVSGHDGTVHLWDTQRNVVLWEYRLTEEKRSEAKYSHPSGITDFVSISPVHSAGTPSTPSHMAHPADLFFVRHLRPHMDPQVLGRTVAYPTYAKDGPNYRVIVSDTASKNSEYPSDTFLKYIYEFPPTFAEAHPPSSRPTNVLYDDATRIGTCVFPFGRLQSQEQWSLLLTGNAWTLAWWNRLGSFLFADEPTRHTVHTIPLMSIGNAERNLRIRLRYEKDMRTNTLSSDATHYYRLNDIDGKTGAVKDLGTAQVNALNKGAALYTTDKLPLNAASQAFNNSNYAASDTVTVFPSDAMHASSSVNTYIDATGAFEIPSETMFSLSMWMHPSLNRTTSDDSFEILFRNAPLKQTTQYVEISYNPSSHLIHLQVRDQSQLVELETSVPNDACMSTYNSGGHPWMFIMVTRDSSNLIHLYVNDEEQSVSSTAVTGNLYTSGTEGFVGYNFQGALRDVGYWEGHDFSTQPLNRDILYNYGEIRTYPFDVPYHQSWRLEAVFVHPNGPSPSHVVFDEHVRTPINMHVWAKQWQAMSLEWEVDWASHQHVFRVWHGNGYSRNTMDTGSHSLYEVTVDRKDYPALFSPDTQLWFGATPTKDPFDTPTHGYPQPCFAHVAAWTRLLHTAERSFFLLGDRETTTAATKSLSSERGTAIREAHPLDFSQYGPQRASERAGEVNEHRDISRNPHRRWMLLLSHEDWGAPIACTMQPVQPHLEEKFYEELQTKGQPSDLQNALSKNGAQVVYYTWGEGNTERPDSYGNQEANYATAQNVWEKDPDKQTPLRT
jgi:hypothetical protein